MLLLLIIHMGCSVQRQHLIDESRKDVRNLINVGDDIYQAKERLKENGFKIKYGPDFPTKTKKYLMMIVDFGADPNLKETVAYTLGAGEGSGPIDGIIKADPNGVITSIE